MADDLRPDVYHELLVAKEDEADEHSGFVCHDCGWRGTFARLDLDGDGLDVLCDDCNGTHVENLLSTHVEEILGLYEAADKTEAGFVRYRALKYQFSGPWDRFDRAMNHLLTDDRAYILFIGGRPRVAIPEALEDGEQ